MRASKAGLINDVLSNCSHTRLHWVPTGLMMEGTTPESYISRTGSGPWNNDGARYVRGKGRLRAATLIFCV